MEDDDKKWQAENDARTLKDAAMICKDKERHAAAMEILNKEMEAVQSMMEGKAKMRFPQTYKEE